VFTSNDFSTNGESELNMVYFREIFCRPLLLAGILNASNGIHMLKLLRYPSNSHYSVQVIKAYWKIKIIINFNFNSRISSNKMAAGYIQLLEIAAFSKGYIKLERVYVVKRVLCPQLKN